MKISLLTDAPRHNLALMKLSAYHKERGDIIRLNQPLWPADKRYASILFEWNADKFLADEYGGPGYNFEPLGIECRPDYGLYGLDYSLGYTFRYCFRNCQFCKVTRMEKDRRHYSIWDFHNPTFKKICLLNNNTFFDPRWRETFEEIWDADLTMIDENGYDLRLLDDDKADALHRTKWATPLHFAWDRISDESEIIRGLKLLETHHLRTTSNGVYVLIGYDTTREEDLHRCQIIDDHGLTPYPMPYVFNDYTRRFKRFMNLHYYRQAPTIEKAWKEYFH
jgi:hypothetical protein